MPPNCHHLIFEVVKKIPKDVSSRTIVFLAISCGELALELPRPLAASAKPLKNEKKNKKTIYVYSSIYCIYNKENNTLFCFLQEETPTICVRKNRN